MTLEIVVAAILASKLAAPPPCPIEDCLRRLRQRVEIELAEVDASGLVGHWTRGGGLTGSELYLFEDRTYIYTEWGCVQPETIHDKGRWTAESRVVAFVPDQEVTWSPGRGDDRRYAVLKLRGELRLVGLDGSLEFLERFSKKDSPESLEFLARSRAEPWKPGEAQQIKARLLATAWRPSYFEGDKEAEEQ